MNWPGGKIKMSILCRRQLLHSPESLKETAPGRNHVCACVFAREI